jgi:MFS family permease
MILMGIFGGGLVDAFDRRTVLIAASSVSFVAPIGIALLAWSEVTALWPYYLFTTLSATIGALVGAARFAIHPRLVPRNQLSAVAALSGVSAGLQAGVGPALAGILVATVGYSWTYTIDIGLFLVGFWGIVSLPSIKPVTAARLGLASLLDGLRFLRSAGNLRTAIALQVASFAFGRSYAIMPAIGFVLIGGGAATVGFLTASAAVGVIVSGLLSGPLNRVHLHGKAIAVSTAATAIIVALFGLAILALQLSPRGVGAERVDVAALLLLCVLTALAGAAENVSGIFRTTMMQSATPDEMRGRLQGLYTLVLSAGPRLGDVFAGFLAAAGALWFPPLLGAVLIATVVAAFYRGRPRFRAYNALEPIA